MFANSGWDGNWYVGYNTFWIQKIPVPAKNNIARAFVGAKLGRMKNVAVPGRPPWEKEAIPGEVFMAVSSSPTWTKKQHLLLTKTDDLPLEADFENAVEGVGESQWFWREVPIDQIRFGGDNYIALWSPTQAFTSVSSAPILAAGWGNKDANSWIGEGIKGEPRLKSDQALSKPITVFEPAIALKLVPRLPDGARPPSVRITRVMDGKARGKYPAPKVFQAAVSGESIERAWIEIATEPDNWKKFGRITFKAPYIFSIRLEEVPMGRQGKTWARIAASDAYENVGYSAPISLFERKEP